MELALHTVAVLLGVARGKVGGFLDRQSEEAWDDVGIVAKFNMWRRGSVPVAKCFKKLGDKNPIRGAQPIQMHPLIHAVFGIMMFVRRGFRLLELLRTHPSHQIAPPASPMDLQPVVEAKAQRHPVTSYYEAQMRLEGCHLRISSMDDTCVGWKWIPV